MNCLLEESQSKAIDEVVFIRGKSVNDILIEEIKKPVLINKEKKEFIKNLEFRNIKVILIVTYTNDLKENMIQFF